MIPKPSSFLRGNSKTWYVAAAENGHLGVGPATGENFTFPQFYAAPPFDKADSPCFYNDELTFSLEGRIWSLIMTIRERHSSIIPIILSLEEEVLMTNACLLMVQVKNRFLYHLQFLVSLRMRLQVQF